jgi:hypothetical protein
MYIHGHGPYYMLMYLLTVLYRAGTRHVDGLPYDREYYVCRVEGCPARCHSDPTVDGKVSRLHAFPKRKHYLVGSTQQEFRTRKGGDTSKYLRTHVLTKLSYSVIVGVAVAADDCELLWRTQSPKAGEMQLPSAEHVPLTVRGSRHDGCLDNYVNLLLPDFQQHAVLSEWWALGCSMCMEGVVQSDPWQQAMQGAGASANGSAA